MDVVIYKSQFILRRLTQLITSGSKNARGIFTGRSINSLARIGRPHPQMPEVRRGTSSALGPHRSPPPPIAQRPEAGGPWGARRTFLPPRLTPALTDRWRALQRSVTGEASCAAGTTNSEIKYRGFLVGAEDI